MVTALENHFLLYPLAEAFYRSANGKYFPGLVELITSTLVDGESPPMFKGPVPDKLTYVRQWEKNPD